MIIKFEDGSQKKVDFFENLNDLFSYLKLNYEEYIVSRSDTILTSDSKLSKDDILLFINVVSGG